MSLKEIKKRTHASTCSVRNGIITLRWVFFYRMGKDTEYHIQKVLSAFPHARIIDSGEIWKDFRGGQSVSQGSHWYVKFALD